MLIIMRSILHYTASGVITPIGVLPICNTPIGVLQIGRSLVRSQLVSVDFFFDIKSFRSHYGPGVYAASNRNEHQEYLLGVKAAGKADSLTPSCVVTKSWNLNFLEPSGPLRACNGTDLPSFIRLTTDYKLNFLRIIIWAALLKSEITLFQICQYF